MRLYGCGFATVPGAETFEARFQQFKPLRYRFAVAEVTVGRLRL